MKKKQKFDKPNFDREKAKLQMTKFRTEAKEKGWLNPHSSAREGQIWFMDKYGIKYPEGVTQEQARKLIGKWKRGKKYDQKI